MSKVKIVGYLKGRAIIPDDLNQGPWRCFLVQLEKPATIRAFLDALAAAGVEPAFAGGTDQTIFNEQGECLLGLGVDNRFSDN